MEQTTKFLIIGMVGIFAMLLAPALNAAPAAAAIGDDDGSQGVGNQKNYPDCREGSAPDSVCKKHYTGSDKPPGPKHR